MNTTVSVIILNLNGKKFLETCLGSLRKQTYKNFETILVDNGSADDSVSFIQKNFPEIKIIRNEKNLGFTRGNNQGFEVSKGRFIVTLNNDTIADRNWLKELVVAAEKDGKVGMVASKILFARERNRIDSVGVNIALDGMTKQRGGREIDEGQYNKEEEILFPSACAALYKRKMIEEIGFFDDDFFAYCEDSDLGLRGRLAEWKAVFVPDAVVYHYYSGTAGKYSTFKLYLVERNHVWLVVKNFPSKLLIFFPFLTVYRFLLQFIAILSGRGMAAEAVRLNSRRSLIKSILKAYHDAFKKLPLFIRKREIIQKKRKLSEREFYLLLKKYRLSFKDLVFRG